MKVLSLILLSTVFLVGGCDDGRVDSSGCQVKEPAAMADSNDKIVVLVFDDGTVSQYKAGKLLCEYGFGGTFFISEADFKFHDDPKMNWTQIKELHDIGLEIGNHTYTHFDTTKLSKEDFFKELKGIEDLCESHDIPKPVTMAYPGYHANDTVAGYMKEAGYLYAREGGGAAFDPQTDDPHRMPTCASYSVPSEDGRLDPPGDTMQYFIDCVSLAKDGKVAVVTYHGIPDMHNVEVALFKQHLDYLKNNDYTCIAMRDIHLYR